MRLKSRPPPADVIRMPAILDYLPKGQSAAGVFFIFAVLMFFKTAWAHSLGTFTSRGKYDVEERTVATRDGQPIEFRIRLIFGYAVVGISLIVGLIVYGRS